MQVTREKMSGYLYANTNAAALTRLRALEEIEDPATRDLLARAGVTRGCSCLEIGAGAGSIAYWMADRVGGSGQVVATDIEPRFLDIARCDVWRHDISRDALPSGKFDVVHCRHTLIHVDQGLHSAIATMLASSLKPRGALVLQESDFATWAATDSSPMDVAETYNKGVDAVLSIYRQRGMDVSLGVRLSRLVKDAGLVVSEETRRAREVQGGSDEARFHEETFRQLLGAEGVRGSAMAAAIHNMVECLRDPRLTYATRTTAAVIAARE